MTVEIGRYSHVKSRKHEGAHYTPRFLSDFISEKIVSFSNLEKTVRIVDPAIGDGELLISLIEELHKHSITNIEVYGFDTNPSSIAIAHQRINRKFPELSLNFFEKDFLQVCLDKYDIFASHELKIPDFDILIANPPYIRTQVMGAEQAELLRKNFGLKGRVDIYQAFLVAMKVILKRSGIAGVIVSNRFLTTKGAGVFREFFFNNYSIKGIWDFGDTKVFEAAVLPAVMVFSPDKSQKQTIVPFSSIYETTDKKGKDNIPQVENQTEAFKFSGVVSSPSGCYDIKHGYLEFDSNPSNLWRLQTSESKNWLDEVDKNTWCTFGDIGKIRVGVKTTADNVFIREDWEAEVGFLPELLMPLTTHHIAGRFRSKQDTKRQILYTHTSVDRKRKVHDLEKYPLAKKYLELHRKQLTGRKYVLKANRQWYEIWVPQNPSLWKESKIVFKDIAEQPTFWMDEDGSVVNGDCYWMVRNNQESPTDILWLILAIANSSFIEDYYDLKFQNKLYSNRRRFITQYVEHFPIPDPELEISKKLVFMAKKCYSEKDHEKRKHLEYDINKQVWAAFQVEKYSSSRD